MIAVKLDVCWHPLLGIYTNRISDQRRIHLCSCFCAKHDVSIAIVYGSIRIYLSKYSTTRYIAALAMYSQTSIYIVGIQSPVEMEPESDKGRGNS